jgi:hypothetical protein
MSTYDIAGRGPGKFRSLRSRRRRPPPSPGTVRYIKPCPKTPPEEASKIRARLAGATGWELDRIDRPF